MRTNLPARVLLATFTLLMPASASTAFAAASLTPLGGLNAGGIFSRAFGVSGDGSVVVGDTNNSFLLGEAFRWTSTGGMVGLGHLPGGLYSSADDISDDGSVIVGFSGSASGDQPFRWTSAGGMVGLGGLHAGDRSQALGVSADGSVVVGLSRDDNFSVGEAFRWTSGGGMVGLGHLPGGLYSSADDISDDGSVIVGFSGSASGDQPFRWTSAGGMVGLGTLPGGVRGQALGVSGDGSVVVGFRANGGASSEAFYWTADGGMRDLWDLLLSQGVDPAGDGWTELTSAWDISADGNTFVGSGIRNGNTEAFVAVIPTIVPEPGTFSILALGAFAALRRRRSRPACCETLEPRRLLSFSPATSFSVGTDPQAVVAADFNNDGKLDLATANAGGNTVSVLLGNGQGGFGAASHFAAGSGPLSLVVSDFNNDGRLDLAAANPDPWGSGRMSVLLGNGDGTFQSPLAVPLHSPTSPVSVGVADFNADQNMDLVVVSPVEYSSGTGGWFEVLLNDGTGAFPTYQLTEGSLTSLLAIDDFNADGTPDLVLAHDLDVNEAWIQVWLGEGNGYFFPSDLTIGSGFHGGAGDFTGDGILDLVTAGQTVDVLPGLGDGTFAAPLSNPTNGNPPGTVTVADFNGDGKLDVVTSDGDTGTVSLLLGNGDGTLRYIGAFAAGSSPSAVAVGDFNGDGRPDVAAANSGSNNVSVLLNDGVWAGNKTFVGPGGNGSGGNWSNAGNWSPPGVPAATDHVAISGKSVNLGSSATVASLTLTGGAALSIGSNGSRVLRTSSLMISGSGSKLDLKDNDMIVDYAAASLAVAVEAKVRDGYNVTGDWLGDGITSSTAAADGNFTLAVADNALLPTPFGTAQGGPLFAGVDVDLTSVLVKFTHRADIDLDGLITPNDAAIFGGNYSENDFANWATGDMDYDGLFTPTDAAIFGGFYDESLPQI